MKDLIYKIYATLFANRAMLYFNKLLFQLSLRGMGVLNHYNSKLSGERYLLQRILPKHSPSVVFDVGANIGNYTLELSKYNKCKIYCFEPVKETYKILLQNTSNLKEVTTEPLGMSNQIGEAIIYDDLSQSSSSKATLYADVISEFHSKDIKSSTISLSTIDDYCSKKNIDRISLLKIDTEGNEFKIIEGASTMISSGKIELIHFEFNAMNIASGVFFRDFYKKLPDYNFYRLLPNSLLPINYANPVEYELFAYQNIVAIRKNIDKRQ